MIGDTGQLHNDYTQVIYALRDFQTYQFFDGHMPAEIIDGCRTIVQAIGKRSNLVVRSALCNLFKCTVDIPYRHFCFDHTLAINLHYILENTVRSRVRRTKVNGRRFLFYRIFRKLYMLFNHKS
ncbi:hypothetical protein D9M68_626430 [compost metagenome]